MVQMTVEWCTGMITLREHFEGMLAAQEKATEQALRLSERAVEKAEAAQEKRLDALNEIRQMAEDERRLSMPRAEAEIRLAAIERALSERQGMGQGWAIALGSVAMVVSIVSAIVALTR